MAKFNVNTHGRLQEWIAHDKGFIPLESIASRLGSVPDRAIKYETLPSADH